MLAAYRINDRLFVLLFLVTFSLHNSTSASVHSNSPTQCLWQILQVSVRALRCRSLLTHTAEIEMVSPRLSTGGLSEDQHPARLRGRHQDHVLEPEQDRRRHQAHLPSDWDLPSDGLCWKRAGIWQQHAVFTHHQYGKKKKKRTPSLLIPAAAQIAWTSPLPWIVTIPPRWIKFRACATLMRSKSQNAPGS